MSFNYLTIGFDCSPAAALKELNLREFALPFDWIVCNIKSIQICFETKFKDFHKNLTFNHNKTRLIDHYGFEFPHDYPLTNMTNFENNIGEGVFGEEQGNCITEKWYSYYSDVLDKYNRRIERFNNIVNDTKPIIVLCRYNTKDIFDLQELFIKYYKNNNIYFVNSCYEPFENDYIKNIYTEKENKWNDVNIWKEGINAIIKKIKQ
jgi:hypothetical protein|uniref:Papain-like cysteine peptidase n=1 Tax=viral metagenome TaxID=1070528 RepID=A0A6C0CD41_9ZZZZ